MKGINENEEIAGAVTKDYRSGMNDPSRYAA